MEKYMLPCLNKKLFGFECPGCGGQRALVMLLKGDFTEAFFMYPAIYPLAILVICVGVNLVYPYKLYSKTASTLTIISITTIVISYIFKQFIA
ncbi:Protein of unknown function [Mesonia phycicola]|uniref:DUF2752 domain-containing protein n=1 Tax=Mesonia phycicola TaxID=579105 RepID=A0A1M6E125_9FLAO|nr:DUF2752 domain-containing protein [Mesonia phycicola]SHI79224.1 Protein of unknown function [Mesonia phycicola]